MSDNWDDELDLSLVDVSSYFTDHKLQKRPVASNSGKCSLYRLNQG